MTRLHSFLKGISRGCLPLRLRHKLRLHKKLHPQHPVRLRRRLHLPLQVDLKLHLHLQVRRDRVAKDCASGKRLQGLQQKAIERV